MADDKRDMNEPNTQGTDWEFVSLTASTYAAAPDPQGFDPVAQHINQEFNKTEQDCNEALLMSKHFVVPQGPGNLPSEHYSSEIYKEQILNVEKFSEPCKFNKEKGKIDSDSDLFDTGHTLSDHNMEFGDGKQEEDPKTLKKEHALFLSPNYNNFVEEVDMNLPVVHDDITDFVEPRNLSPENFDYPSLPTHDCKPNEENHERCDESHEAWWKKRAISVYNNAKGTNTFWSIFVAVAVAGLVILGQRWQREKSYFQQFKWKFGGTDEKIDRMAGPVNRIKVLLGGNHRSGSMREGLHPSF